MKKLEADKKRWRDFIIRNTERNKNGDAVISEKDSWFYEDEWDDYYKELTADD